MDAEYSGVLVEKSVSPLDPYASTMFAAGVPLVEALVQWAAHPAIRCLNAPPVSTRCQRVLP
jgi:hypothetical protein